MPRKKLIAKKQLMPDPRFNSVLVSKFTNCLMDDGKKSIARHLFYGAMDIIDQRISDEEPLEVFEAAMENVRPRVEVKSRRVGGATYQVPVEVRPDRRNALAIRHQPRLDLAFRDSKKNMVRQDWIWFILIKPFADQFRRTGHPIQIG